MTRFTGAVALVAVLILCLAEGSLAAEHVSVKSPANALEGFSESVQALAAKVTPSVVQIVVDRYTRDKGDDDGAKEDKGDKQSIGSGVIIDPTGYIVTNAHVVEDGLRIRVRLPRPPADDDDHPIIGAALEESFSALQDAKLIGIFKSGDLALVKINAHGLPSLKFADYQGLRQGQVVFAFGSREGLQNSMSMGVVSSVARQLDADSPFIYIQTDAAINPGDSGGPLVNTNGEVVGIDTLILSNSGGSEGLGFAIPSALVELVAAELKAHGHFHRSLIGVSVQSIQPTLAAALSLPQTKGVIVTDVLEDSPASKGGLRPDDIIVATDGHAVRNLPLFMLSLLTAHGGKPLNLTVLRGKQNVAISVIPKEETNESDAVGELIASDGAQVPQLGIIGINVCNRSAKSLPELRLTSGVYVAAWSNASGKRPPELLLGDVIHRVNGTAVNSSTDLVRQLRHTKRGDPIALWIERDHKMQYITFEY
jgi:serine protease Do